MRYTEYHGGKAVIKDKNTMWADAMQKLARYEDLEDIVQQGEELTLSVEQMRQKLEQLTGKKVIPDEYAMVATLEEYCETRDYCTGCLFYGTAVDLKERCVFHRLCKNELKSAYEKVVNHAKRTI